MTSCSKRGYHDRIEKKKRVWFGQIFVTISKVPPNICEKSRQKSVTISVTLRSTLLSFCQIFMTITREHPSLPLHLIHRIKTTAAIDE